MVRYVIRDRDLDAGDVLIDTGIFDTSDALSTFVPEPLEPSQIAMFLQPGSQHLGEAIAAAITQAGIPVSIRVLPDRDAAKQLSVVEGAYLWMNQLALMRNDMVLAVGGGALTDVAGFIAATYLRGVPIVLAPTTFLGAIDASIGGKTAINVGGKNLAGAFRHPNRVVIDTDVLEQLPTHLVREGSAEAFKHGLLADPVLVELYEEQGLEAPMFEVVDRSVKVKVDVVNQDFMEQGVRGWLNYGHTIGHAVEVLGGMSHGDAVGVGMVAAAAASHAVTGFAESDRQNAILERLGLPTSVEGISRTDAEQLVALDKKRDNSGLRMTLLERIGSPIVTAVEAATVATAFDAIGIS